MFEDIHSNSTQIEETKYNELIELLVSKLKLDETIMDINEEGT